MKIKLFLIRHSESVINENKMKFYINDPHISKKGIEQCKELKKFLKNNDILSKKKNKMFLFYSTTNSRNSVTFDTSL